MVVDDAVFHVFLMYVFKCFIWMLRMLQWLYTHVASMRFRCFKCMFQVFHLDVA